MMLLQQAADVAGGASKVTDGNILTILATIIATIFGALTLTQRSQVEGLKDILANCRSGRDKDIEYERKSRAEAEGKEDKCLDRMATTVASMTELSTAVKENAIVGTAIVQEVRAHATRVDLIVRTQDTMGRDLVDVKRALDDVRYRRGAGGTHDTPPER